MTWRDTPVPGRAVVPQGAPVVEATDPLSTWTPPLVPTRASLGAVEGGIGRAMAVAVFVAVASVAVWLFGFATTPITSDEAIPVPALESASTPTVQTGPPYGPYPSMRSINTRIHVRPNFSSAHRELVVAPGAHVMIHCRVTGPAVEGPFGTTTDWDYIVRPAQGYVPDAFINTTAFDDIPRC